MGAWIAAINLFQLDLHNVDAGDPQSHFIMPVAIAVGFEHFQCIRLS